jgi:hypothetical protein
MKDLKSFNVRVPKELWAFLKKRSVDCDIPMNAMIISMIRKEKDKLDRKLTNNDA